MTAVEIAEYERLHIAALREGFRRNLEEAFRQWLRAHGIIEKGARILVEWIDPPETERATPEVR